MSTFPYAFPKTLVLNGTVASVTSGNTYANSWELQAGDFGLFDVNTKAVVTTSNVGSHPYVYAAQGSFYTVDSLGNTPLGRLKESVKTQGINAKYVTKFYKKTPVTALNHIIQIGGTASSLNFEAGQTYQLRVETKGSQALRVLNRHMYKNVPFYTGCASNDCLTGCDKEYVDPASVLYGWASYINTDPLLSIFVRATAYVRALSTTTTGATTASTTLPVTSVGSGATAIVAGQLVQGTGISPNTTVVSVSSLNVTLSNVATVANGATVTFNNAVTSAYSPVANSTTPPTDVAFLILSGGYTDTTFNDCSFNPYDFYQVEPLIIYASIVDEKGDPCSTGPVANSNVGTNTSEIQAPVQPQGVGETVLRDLLLSMEYDGIHFNTDPRMRQVENNPALSAVNRTHLYTRYYIQYHIPTHINPNNTVASNQYLVCFAFDASVSTSDFETLITDWLLQHNPQVLVSGAVQIL